MKRFLTFIILCIIALFTCACNKKESYVLFNKHPFTKDTMTSGTNVFAPGEKIYYLITTPKPVESKRLLIQVVKLGKNERLGYDLVWGKQVKIRDEQIYYYTDYFVFNETGAYTVKVYSKDEPTKILTTNDFYIRN